MKKIINVVAAIIHKGNKIMIAKRGYGDYKGYFEFPGGKVEENESGEAAIKREIKEELNANIEVERLYTHVHYDYPKFILEMDCYLCRLEDEHLEPLEHEEIRWITIEEENIDFAPADILVYSNIMKDGI